MDIIWAMHPRFAKSIYEGRKKIELRKIIPWKFKENDRAYIYETYPVQKITGYITAKAYFLNIFRDGSEDEKYKKIAEMACVSFNEFMEYYEGKDIATFFDIKEKHKFETTKTLADFGINNVPQSFCYVKEKK